MKNILGKSVLTLGILTVLLVASCSSKKDTTITNETPPTEPVTTQTHVEEIPSDTALQPTGRATYLGAASTGRAL